jgi:ribosomal subunit interface protein
MRYQISGKQIDIGTSLQTHVQTDLNAILEKYAGRPTDAYVVFSKTGHEFICDAVVHLSTGLTAQATDRASDIYAAFNGCAEKMDKQLRRYKRRLKDHHKDRLQPVELSASSSYILAPTDESNEADDSAANPIIVAEMEEKIQSLSAGEAVMQMELANKPVLVFRNEKHGGVNVVYRREDGNIGWIDPRSLG